MLVLLITWTTGVLLLFVDFRNMSARWASATVFCGGVDGLSIVIENYVKPLFESNPAIFQSTVVEDGTSFIAYYLTPYTFCMFGIMYSGFVSRKYTRLLQFFLLIPILFIFYLISVTPNSIHPITYFWKVPYILAGSTLLICSYFMEKNPFMRRIRCFTNLGFIPTMMFVLTNHYILPSLGIKDGWQYSRWIIIFSFVVFILSLFRHGFLRTRIRIERQHISSLQQLTSEASMLNQAIRNDQGRIKWYGDKIKTYAMATDQKVLEEDMNTILYAYQRMQDTMSRIQQKTKEHDLHLEKNSVLDIVKHCLNRLKDHLHASGVDIQIQCVDPSLVSWCDRLQIEETLHNIISNAIEAMPYGGVLTVQIDESKKKVLLSIKDTGMGIPKKHLTRILEPFFSTKLNSRENFGLGLSFCYHVMKKHKGNIDFDTKEGEGTTVYLSFPKKMRR